MKLNVAFRRRWIKPVCSIKPVVCQVKLSGGEQQRVGIARAVVNRPTLLVADEPTGNLDPELSNRVLRLFEEFNRAGVTILLATHDIGLVKHSPTISSF